MIEHLDMFYISQRASSRIIIRGLAFLWIDIYKYTIYRSLQRARGVRQKAYNYTGEIGYSE
jgi:hypothetical protein